MLFTISPHRLMLLLEVPLLFYLYLRSSLFPSRLPTTISHAFRNSPMFGTCPAHLTSLNLITLEVQDK
jgi:hypothetical protein